MTIKIEKIETSPTDASQVHVELSRHAPPGASETFYFACPKFSVLEALLQLHVVEEVRPFSVVDVTEKSDIRKLLASGNDLKWLKGIQIQPSPIGFCASVKDGDSRAHVSGSWSLSRMGAIANVIKEHGYKTSMVDIQTGNFNAKKWIEDFQYGFKRISDEIFAAEMEMIVSPEKGAW